MVLRQVLITGCLVTAALAPLPPGLCSWHTKVLCSPHILQCPPAQGYLKKLTGIAVAKLQHVASPWSGIKQPCKHCITSVITVCHRAGLPTDVLYLCSPHNLVYPSAGVSFLCPPSSLPDCEIDQPLLAVRAWWGAAKEWGGVHEQPSPCGEQVLVSSGQRPVLL